MTQQRLRSSMFISPTGITNSRSTRRAKLSGSMTYQFGRLHCPPSISTSSFSKMSRPTFLGSSGQSTPPAQIAYYDEPPRNHESKFRLSSSELRMEFYLDIIQNFASPGENFFGVYTGAKCMLAAKVVTHCIGGL